METFCNGSSSLSFLVRRHKRVSRFCSWSPRRAPHSGRYEGGSECYQVGTYVFNELLKCLLLPQYEWRLFHWRERDGSEVDIVAENGNLLAGFEMKAPYTISASNFKNFHTFKAGPARKWNFVGLVIYLGDKALTFGDKHFAIPLSMFLSHGKPTDEMASVHLHND